MNQPDTIATTRSWIRGPGAVVAGLLVNVVLSLVVDVVMHATGVFPAWFRPMPGELWALALAYRAVFAVAGGWTTARLAPRRAMSHVGVLVAIGTLLGVLGAAATWSKGPEFGPRWYAVGLVVAGAAGTLLGGLADSSRLTRAASRTPVPG